MGGVFDYGEFWVGDFCVEGLEFWGEGDKCEIGEVVENGLGGF